MNERKMLEAIGSIDPALVQEASAPSRGRRRRIRPLWIAAACLCLIVSGTALAAQLPAISQLFLRVLPQGEGSGYTVAGGAAYLPAGSLSEEIHALAQEHPRGHVGRSFATWEEMKDFIGYPLPDNPVLADAPAGKETQIDGTMGRHVVRISADDQGLSSVLFFSGCDLQREAGTVSILVQGTLYMEPAEETEEPDYEEGRFYVEGTKLTRESYVTPGGLEAELLQIQRPEGKRVLVDGESVAVTSGTEYIALFSLEGVRYLVEAECEEDPSLALAALKEVLDGFAAGQ